MYIKYKYIEIDKKIISDLCEAVIISVIKVNIAIDFVLILASLGPETNLFFRKFLEYVWYR